MSAFLVYVVDDDIEVARSIALLVGTVGLRAIVCHSAQDFLAAYSSETPGCLILDVRMPGMSGPDLQARLTSAQHRLPIIFITGHGDIPTAVRAMQHGALDVLEKPFNDQVLLNRVFEAERQDTAWRREKYRIDEATERIGRLTPREREVLDLIINGATNRIVGSALDLSVRTVEVHRANIMKKLHADSVAELVRVCLLVPSVAGVVPQKPGSAGNRDGRVR